MKHHFRFIHLALIVGFQFFFLSAASAQDAPVLKGKQVTESALIDALSVEAPDQQDSPTRSLLPSTGVGSRSAHAKAGPGKASLLITFTKDSAELTPDAMSILDTVAKAFSSDQLAGNSFQVQGHADPRGTEAHNVELSRARAEAVIAYLITKHGILPDRMAATGKGSSELMYPNQPDAPENRRVTIVTKPLTP